MKKVLSILLILTTLFSALPLSISADNTYTYEELEGFVKKVNDHWIATHTWTPGYEWDTATYYIGCMDAYYLTGIEEYRKYTQTQKYVEEVAKEKLGLVNENEIIFKSEE